MGFFDFLKPKPKSKIEELANNCVKKVESGTESEAKLSFVDITSRIKTNPTIINTTSNYSIVGKALFIVQFMGMDSSSLSKNAVVSLSYYCLSKAIQTGNNKTDSAKTLIHLLQQSHSNLEGIIRKAISSHKPTTDKEVKESLTKIMYYIMKSCPGSASGNQQAQFMESSLDSMIKAGRLGTNSNIYSVSEEGKKYFNWLKDHLELMINNQSIAHI